MYARSLSLFLLIVLALPALGIGIAYQIRPPAFVWLEDPINLLVSRTPVALWPGNHRVEALGNQVTAMFKDGARTIVILLDDVEAAQAELERLKTELVGLNASLQGEAPSYTYQRTEESDGRERFGRFVRAESAVVQVEAMTESSLQHHFVSVPALLDQSGDSLGRSIFDEHLRSILVGLGFYLFACAIIAVRLLRAGRHGRRSGLAEQ